MRSWGGGEFAPHYIGPTGGGHFLSLLPPRPLRYCGAFGTFSLIISSPQAHEMISNNAHFTDGKMEASRANSPAQGHIVLFTSDRAALALESLGWEFEEASFCPLSLSLLTRRVGKTGLQARKGSATAWPGHLAMALSISGPPCSQEHEGRAQGSCSEAILRFHAQGFTAQTHRFLKLLSGALCPEAPRPGPLTCHAGAGLPLLPLRALCRPSGRRVGAASQPRVHKAGLRALLPGQSES